MSIGKSSISRLSGGKKETVETAAAEVSAKVTKRSPKAKSTEDSGKEKVTVTRKRAAKKVSAVERAAQTAEATKTVTAETAKTVGEAQKNVGICSIGEALPFWLL